MNETIDLNCDLGEIDETPTLELDSKMLNYVSSINIACGYHAGDRERMRKLIRFAIPKGIAIGAHPGYPDREHFGRRSLNFSEQQIKEMVRDQIETLSEIAIQEGARLHHVKPHGALYNQGAEQKELAHWIAESILETNSTLYLVGLSGSCLLQAGKEVGLKVLSEVFADRQYGRDGKLVDRALPNALIHDENEGVRRVLSMIRDSKVESIEGDWIPTQADTICIHGDSPNAVAMAARLCKALRDNGILVMPRRT